MKYGERLKAARKHKKLTQQELVDLSSVPQGTISKIERGDQKKSTYDVALASALDVDARWLQNGDMKYAPEWLMLGDPQTLPPTSPERPALPQGADLSALMSAATPRTHATLEAIEKAWQAGQLTEEDLKLLDTIARRLAHDQSRQDR